MDEILVMLQQDGRLSAEDIAKATGKAVADVKKKIKEYEKKGIIVKYKAVLNDQLVHNTQAAVRAMIEVRVTPQKDRGFDHVAERIYKFPEVKSCYLLSGSYDLLLVVEGSDIQTIAHFVSSKLSPLADVHGTATHFMLQKYKEDGDILKTNEKQRRINISI